MAGTSLNYNITSKTSRAEVRKLHGPRPKPYYRQIAPNIRLGYICREHGGSWIVAERINGKEKTRVLGQADDVGFVQANGVDVLTFEQAQRKATDDGPATPLNKLTVGRAIDIYYDILKAEKPRADVYRANLMNHLPEHLAATKVDKLSTTELKQWQASLVLPDPKNPDAKVVTKSTANRILSQLKAPLNDAFKDEKNRIPSSAAWDRVEPFPGADQAREDDLDFNQVRALIAAAASYDQALANLMEATFLIGCRAPGELANVERRHFDAARKLLVIPSGKTGKRNVTLTAEAVAFFSELAKDKLPNAPLVPRADGKRWPASGHFNPVKKAVALAKLPPSVCLYTLRHAHISRAIESGMSLKVIAANCGTSLAMIDQNYAKVLASSRQEHVEKTGPKLRTAK